MPETRPTAVSDLRPGDRLGQDIMQGNTVLLRQGTVLQEAQIERIGRLGLQRVTVLLGLEEARQLRGRDPLELAQVFAQDQPRWMSDAAFAEPVTLPGPLSPDEDLFQQHKEQLRSAAGLRPLIDPLQEGELQRSLQTVFIAAASHGRVDLERVEEAALTLAASVPSQPQHYLQFSDIARYGQHLISRSILSSKVFLLTRFDEEQTGPDWLKAHLALQNLFALLPMELSQPLDMLSDEARIQLRTALIRFYNWLRGQGFVDEEVLEHTIQQFERQDGMGLPFGLAGEKLTPEGQAWALALSYAERVYSRPNRPRISPYQAADELVRQSGSSFASSAVNRFLRIVGFFPNGSLVELNDGRLAIVVRQNERGLLKPVVRTVEDATEMDLKSTPSVFIRRQVLEY